MTYKQIKWLILIIPTLTIGLWEYIRHNVLFPYISMELGNWLAPVIVLLVTVTFVKPLFTFLEKMQDELNRERGAKAIMEEREKMARELHDGIAQSLFLLSVKVDRQKYEDIGKIVRQVNEYVRQAIANLRYPPKPIALPWMESLKDLAQSVEAETSMQIQLDWRLPEEKLTAKEKVELYATIREALLNVRKHANAHHIWIRGKITGEDTWICSVEDDGDGFLEDPFQHPNRYGLKIIRERAQKMNWTLRFYREAGITKLEIGKEIPS